MKGFLPFRKLRFGLIAANVISILIAGILIILFIRTRFEKQHLVDLQREGVRIANYLVSEVTGPVLDADKAILEKTVYEHKRALGGNLEYIYVLDSKGRVLVHTFEDSPPAGFKDIDIFAEGEVFKTEFVTFGDKRIYDIAVPIEGGRVGVLHAGFSQDVILEELAFLSRVIIGIILVGLLLAVILSVVFSGYLIRPLLSLTAVVRRMGQGDLTQNKAKEGGPDEIRELNRAFNKMAGHLDGARAELRRGYQIQTVLNGVLRVSAEDIPLQAMLERVLRIVTSVSGFAFRPKGAIFLVEDEPEVLVMKAERGMNASQKAVCGRVPFPRCLCGRAASSGEIVFVSGVDEQHENRYDGMAPHGHYCVPVLSSTGETMGVVVLYLLEGAAIVQREKELLSAVAKILSGVIERKKSQEQLWHSSYEWQITFNAAEDTIMLLDPEGRVLRANRACAVFAGKAMAKIIGEYCYRLFYEKDVLPDFCPLEKMRLSKKREEAEFYLSQKEAWILESADPILDSENNLVGSVHILKDITVRKRAEEGLRKIQESLARAQEIAHIGNWDWDIVNNKLWWSDEIYRIFGLKPQEFGATYEAFMASVHPGDRELVEEAVHKTLYEGAPYSIDHRILIPNGEQRIVHEEAEVLFDESNEPFRMVGTVQDITERKRAEEAMSESKERYRLLVEAANDPIMMIDVETRAILDANKKAEVITGMSRQELVGMDCMRLHPENDVEFYKGLFEEAVRSGSGFKRTAVMSHKDGREIPVQISTNVITLQGKKVLQGIFSDITELKKIEEVLKEDKSGLEKIIRKRTDELLRTQKDLESFKRLSDIGALAATIAHELRNPLGVIRVAAYNVKRKMGAAPVESHLKNIEKKIKESEQIIRNLLSYSRIKMPHFEKTDVWKILDECLAHCKDKYAKRDIKFTVKHNDTEDEVIEADPLQINELFTNILDNACEAFSDNKGEVVLVAGLSKEGEYFRMTFRDNGIGVAQGDMRKIFEPFFTTKAKGVGLGLTVCRQVAKLHGGTINITSSAGRGTTVAVELARKRT